MLAVPRLIPSIVGEWPQFLILAVERPATINCDTDGWPPPVKSWYKKKTTSQLSEVNNQVVCCSLHTSNIRAFIKKTLINYKKEPHHHGSVKSWYKESVELFNTSRLTVFGNGSLHFQSVERTDGGNYVCVANNSLGVKESRPINVTVACEYIHVHCLISVTDESTVSIK